MHDRAGDNNIVVHAQLQAIGSFDGRIAETANCRYASYNNKESATDASAIENVLKALDYIDECNELRAKHNLPELKVTDLLIAYAIPDANYTDKNIAHPSPFNVGENLSWGISSGQ